MAEGLDQFKTPRELDGFVAMRELQRALMCGGFIQEWDGYRHVQLKLVDGWPRRLYEWGDYCERAFCPFKIRMDRTSILGGVRVLNTAYHPIPDLTLNAFNAILKLR
jgi:hypothetical protein